MACSGLTRYRSHPDFSQYGGKIGNLCSGRVRTCDLQVMSLASYRLLYATCKRKSQTPGRSFLDHRVRAAARACSEERALADPLPALPPLLPRAAITRRISWGLGWDGDFFFEGIVGKA